MEDPIRQKKRLAVAQMLRNGVADGSLLDGNHLLPVRALAAATCASPVTVLRALKLLRSEGQITGGRRCRPRIPLAEPENTPRIPRPRRSWHVAREHIARIVLTARCEEAAGFFSAKELAGRMGVSRLNVRRALESLSDEGILERNGRRYRQAGSQHSGSQGNRVILAAPANEHGQVTLGFLEEDFLHDLEMQCVTRSLRLETRGFIPYGDGAVFVDSSGHRTDLHADLDTVMGFILVVTDPGHMPEEVFRALFHARKPLAAFDAIGGWELPAYLKNPMSARMFDFSTGRHRGRAVARFLLSLGHRHIAYFSLYHSMKWSQQRYAGLGEAFTAAGLPGAVDDQTLAQAGWGSKYERAAAQYGIRALEKRVGSAIDSWSRKVPYRYSQAIAEETHGSLETGFRRGEIARRMDECFAAALAAGRATAWVAANDDTGIMALEFCRKQGIRVPGQLSLIGFDNKLRALKHGLTSYDFNRHGVIAAMLNFLVRPRSISHLTSRQRVAIPGYIVERETTARRS